MREEYYKLCGFPKKLQLRIIFVIAAVIIIVIVVVIITVIVISTLKIVTPMCHMISVR
jgi:hypothetical protein